MTPRERIIATLSLEKPDRTPTDGWFHSEAIKKLNAYYDTEDWNVILQELGIEGWAECGLGIDFSEYNERATERPGGKPWKKAIWLDDRTYEDAWGVQQRLGEGDWYEEWLTGPLVNAETVDDILKYPFPGTDRIVEPANYTQMIQDLKAEDNFVSGTIANPYKTAWLLRGMDNILMDYLINEDILNCIYDKLFELYQELAVRMTKGGVDMIKMIGDIAMQDRIIMGPEAWRKFDKPRTAALIQACRDINPDLFFFYHSDGNVWDLMDDFVEIGLDVINPIQPECMDPAEVKKNWGDKVALHGGISLQKTLPFGTTDDVRNEVEDLIRNCGYNGGLVAFPSNVIQPDTPVENIITCFHAARDFDLSKL